jgi:hypothetical protein
MKAKRKHSMPSSFAASLDPEIVAARLKLQDQAQ